MITSFYQKKNNLFQSEQWQTFRQELGEKTVCDKENFGSQLGLPFGKSFVWFQKGKGTPQVSKDVIFIRIEPDKKPGKGYRLVESSSLLGGQRSPKKTRVLDLSKTEEELLADMKPKTRYNIRLAEKKGVVVKESDDIDAFYRLLLETSGRDRGYSPHQKEYYQKLMNVLGPKKTAKIFIAFFGDEPIAGILVTCFGEIATYLHGGFSAKSKNLMAPYLCQWQAIKDAKRAGAKVYDFWGVAETNSPNDPWSGITRFKEGFGGSAVEFPGTFDLIVSPFWYNLFSIMAKVRKVFR